MPIANDKKALIHVARAQVGMAEDDYRQLLQRAAGVSSSKDLDQADFDAVMHEFRRLGFRGTSEVVPGDRLGMASPKQQGLILKLWGQFTGDKDKRRLGRWLERKFKVADLRFVEREAASKIIFALGRMLAWKKKRDAAAQPTAIDAGR